MKCKNSSFQGFVDAKLVWLDEVDCEDQDASNRVHEANDDEGNHRWDSLKDNSVNNAVEFQESVSTRITNSTLATNTNDSIG